MSSHQSIDSVRNQWLVALAIVASSAITFGCAVGPDFKRPEPPTAVSYAPKALPEMTASAPGTAGAAQNFSAVRDIPAQWWMLFQSPPINSLIEKAFAANPTIEAAQAALRQARENVYAQEGVFYPSVQANFSASRQKNAVQVISPTLTSGEAIFNLYTPQLVVSYALDAWGGNRRQVESLQAQAEAQRFQLEATYITLSSNVVAAAIQEASVRAQIAAVGDIIDLNRKSLEILRNQFRLGYAMRIDVAAQESALAQAEQLLPPLEKQLEQTRDLIRALVGNTPDRDVEETFELAALHLPEELPVSLPSKLVEQRPDVRAAESNLHAASAQVGVAIANMLPQITLTGNIGSTSTEFRQLFTSFTGFWGLTAGVLQPLFDGGTLLHRKRAADAALEQAAAQYRGAVLTAFQNVADTLHALHSDADALKAAVRAEQAARVTLDLTRKQQQLGYVSYLALLSAEQAFRQASITLVQVQTSRFGDTTALFQALGGGWWNRADVAAMEKE